MNPRKLAKEAENRDPFESFPRYLGVEMARTLIAQADLLEKYRKEHRPDVLACVDNRNHGGSDWRCELCRAYDKLTEEQP